RPVISSSTSARRRLYLTTSGLGPVPVELGDSLSVAPSFSRAFCSFGLSPATAPGEVGACSERLAAPSVGPSTRRQASPSLTISPVCSQSDLPAASYRTLPRGWRTRSYFDPTASAGRAPRNPAPPS